MSNNDNKTRYRKINQVTLIGTAIDAVLTLLKLIFGTLFHSSALIADGIHSLSDIITDIVVVAINKISHKAPDESHPYGHGRFENIGSIFLAITLLLVGLGLGFSAIQSLLSTTEFVMPGYPTLVIALLSVFAKEWIYHYTLKYAKLFHSKLLEANAWHSRSDALSSIVVFAGISASLLGYPIIELLVTLYIAALIIKMAVKLGWQSIQDLVDRAAAPETTAEIQECILHTDGVVDCHMIRTRILADKIYVDAHIEVDNYLSVSEGHYISDAVAINLRQTITQIGDVTLHVDIEHDQQHSHYCLPMARKEIIELINAYSDLAQYSKLTIHYLPNSTLVQLFYKENFDLENLKAQKKRLQQLQPLIKIELLHTID